MQQLQKHFQQHEIRAGWLIDRDEPGVVAKDMAKALEYHDASSLVRKLDDDEKGYVKIQTPGGTQKVLAVTESGVYHATFRSSNEKAKDFRRWVTQDVLPSIRETGSYQGDSAPSEYENDPIIQIRKKQIDLERRVDRLEERDEQNERCRLDAQRQLKRLPEAETEAPEKNHRAKLNEIVRAYAGATSTRPQDAWRTLYREVYYRLGVNVNVRSKNRGISKIEVLDRDGLLPDAYAIARKVFHHALGDRL